LAEYATTKNTALNLVKRSIKAMNVEPEGFNYWFQQASESFDRARAEQAPKVEIREEGVRLSADWVQRAKQIWVEDDALLRDPDAEGLVAAWRRIYNESMPSPVGDELDMGDAFASPYPGGRVVMRDYTKCRSIWELGKAEAQT